MVGYLKRHERYVNDMLDNKMRLEASRELLAYHDKQIQWLQHERLAHLITMLFSFLFLLLSLGFVILNPSTAGIVLSTLLMILSVAYLFHYFSLENGVQRWYSLSNQIETTICRRDKDGDRIFGHSHNSKTDSLKDS